jgi:orotidine-5'-phosphate decarboxylase
MRGYERILVAVDTPDPTAARGIIDQVVDAVGGIKLGMEFFNANGPAGVVTATGSARLFLDLKYHDIPNTVAGAVRSAVTACRPAILNVHASGGRAMMEAAVAANREAAAIGIAVPKLIAVTVLTSLDDDDLAAVGQRGPAPDQVTRLASLAQAAGCDGVVCSPKEIVPIRAACGADFTLVVPGIRPADSAADDQTRVMPPAEAGAAGADYVVIGRPITRAADPAAAARAIAASLP